jgi:RNA polymerase sigma-70 factor (ECF subfamily)
VHFVTDRSTADTVMTLPQSRAAAETDWPERSRELGRLLGRVALQDREAFATLYTLTSGQLLASILRIQRDRAQAEDILQEVYLTVWRSAGGFDAARSQPMTWLSSIARNRAIDSLRHAQSRPRLVGGAPDTDEGGETDPYATVADENPGPADLLARASDRLAIGACMDRLSGLQRQSLALAFFDGLSHAEVAVHLRQPLGSVKSWVRRALATLRSCLDDAVKRGGVAG